MLKRTKNTAQNMGNSLQYQKNDDLRSTQEKLDDHGECIRLKIRTPRFPLNQLRAGPIGAQG
jgi:hypothetical protein